MKDDIQPKNASTTNQRQKEPETPYRNQNRLRNTTVERDDDTKEQFNTNTHTALSPKHKQPANPNQTKNKTKKFSSTTR